MNALMATEERIIAAYEANKEAFKCKSSPPQKQSPVKFQPISFPHIKKSLVEHWI